MHSRHRLAVLLIALLTVTALFLPASARQSPPRVTALATAEILVDGLGRLEGIAVDGTGDVFVSDQETGQILKIVSGDRTTPVGEGLRHPVGLVFDGEGRLLVVEGGRRRVLRFGENSELTTLASGLKRPRWIGVAPDGSVFVTVKGLAPQTDEGDDEEHEPEAVVKVAPEGTVQLFADHFRGLQGLTVRQDALAVAARGRKGEQDGVGTLYVIPIEADGRAGALVPFAANQFLEPRGLADDQLGTYFVSAQSLAAEPWHRHVILRVAPDGMPTLFAENLEDPQGLAFGADGSLYLADGRSGRVVRFVAPPPPVSEETPPPVTNTRQLGFRLRTEAGAQLTALGGQFPVSVMTEGSESVLVPVTLRANVENHLQFFATAAAGRGLTSVPLEVTVIHDDQPPFIELVTPRAGAIVRDTIGAEVFAFDQNGIADVEFRLDGLLIGFDATAPFRVTVDTRAAADGSRTLSAVARDRAGNATGVKAQVTVDNTSPEVRIVVPVSGSIGSGPVEVVVEALDATSGVARVELAVNGATQFVTETPPYRFQFNPQGAGPHVLVAAATDRAGNRAESQPVSITLSGISVRIGEPAEDARIPAGAILVRGQVGAGEGEVGVSVNGIPAAVLGTRFAVLVTVSRDATSLTAVATSAGGMTDSHSIPIVVSATQIQTIALSVTPATGVAPLAVSFSLFGAPPGTIALDFDGNGIVDFTGPALEGQTFTYTQPGLYLPTVVVTDTQGSQFVVRGVVQVYDQTSLDVSLQAKWSAMRDALRRGDIEGALQFIASDSRGEFRGDFAALTTFLPTFSAVLEDIRLVAVHDTHIEYELLSAENGMSFSYYVEFIRDADGTWRIAFF